MAQNTRKASSRGSSAKPKKAAAARAEKKPEPESKEVQFHGLKLELPDRLPETVMFDITDIESGVQMDDPRPIFRLLRSVVGGDQFVAIRNQIEIESLPVGESVMDLMKDVLAEYGLTSGES